MVTESVMIERSQTQIPSQISFMNVQFRHSRRVSDVGVVAPCKQETTDKVEQNDNHKRSGLHQVHMHTNILSITQHAKLYMVNKTSFQVVCTSSDSGVKGQIHVPTSVDSKFSTTWFVSTWLVQSPG